MKKLLVMAAMLALFASLAFAEIKQYDVPGVFSFQYSDGWSKGPRKGATAKELDWLVNTASPTASFHAVLARADFSYDDWIRRTIKTASPERVLVSKGDFVSTSGEKGFRLVWNIKTASGQEFVSTQYLFKGKGDTQILLSGTVDASEEAKFQPVFDGFAQSFAITKAK